MSPIRPWILRMRLPGAAMVVCASLLACGGSAPDATGPALATAPSLHLSLTLPELDVPRDGMYEAWLVAPSGARRSVGRFSSGGTRVLVVELGGATAIEVTVEPADDASPAPSSQLLLRGAISAARAVLRYEGAVTQNDAALRNAPGQFTMFSPSDNDVNGYPSHEEAGVWLFNMSPGETAQKDYYVRMAQLQAGWTYEGWMVRDIDTASEIWLSYGKFVPDWTGALNKADDTGWGPYSGVVDFRSARLEDFPGDDWISNPLGFPWNSKLPLPLNLREKDAAGRVRWSHVVTIEPSTDRGEAIATERPFVLRPYVDAFGDQGPGIARRVTLRAENMPSGVAEFR